MGQNPKVYTQEPTSTVGLHRTWRAGGEPVGCPAARPSRLLVQLPDLRLNAPCQQPPLGDSLRPVREPSPAPTHMELHTCTHKDLISLVKDSRKPVDPCTILNLILNLKPSKALTGSRHHWHASTVSQE